jgi:hypothetical protein
VGEEEEKKACTHTRGRQNNNYGGVEKRSSVLLARG